MDEIIDAIKASFPDHVSVSQKRPGVFQLNLPLFHEDGDVVDLFLTTVNGQHVLCDFGLTLQRLSYAYDIDTPNKELILEKILSENGLSEDNGNISMRTSAQTVFGDIMHITQAFARIGSMRYFKREMVESLFFELLDEFIETELQEFKPSKNVHPIPERPDLEVDYQFIPNGHPVYLFGVKDATKAKLATISCLEFQKAHLNFKSLVVNEDFEKLPKNDKVRLTNACDKQYTSFEEFKASARQFLERERM